MWFPRLVGALAAAWAVLLVALLAPSPLPTAWHPVVHSPASVGLWALTALVAPFVVCVLRWEWIRHGRRQR
ncbi:hypothetical protein [Streptomyces sp. BBFR102]|uniref:hypothetical protein n=1 Tax=Streptomyces sp. BBFR102 TaxID=3448171 RepID=UPI003F53D99E